jgi:tetratricopeptide (TPR) repeat protein/TolB-like protein
MGERVMGRIKIFLTLSHLIDNMASLIPGYEYDIFISYRQKDNKGDRWVSEFVEALKDELESTFKEEISVYFDVNPIDGLLEVNDKGASIKEELKCLVFIPIISRTYCDPRSFAWENEFKAFVEQASIDEFGLKVKLQSGNVANRVLPVRIHDLDSNDIALCESITGGVLRGVEFIYKSPGVNRPLRPKEDKSQDNLNNTIYRDQINKVALAIKDIILGLKTRSVVPAKEIDQQKELSEEVNKRKDQADKKKPVKPTRLKLQAGVAILAILIIAAVLGNPKIIRLGKTANLRNSDGRISIVIMPFQNLTNDIKLNVWQAGIQNELINNLTNSEELKVGPQESINGLLRSQGITNYASMTPSVAGKISAKLDATVFIYGSINQSGATVRVNAQLADSKTGDVVKSFKKEGLCIDGNMLPIIDPLAKEIKNFLIISGLKGEVYLDPRRIGSSDSPEAYRSFNYGMKAFSNGDFTEAVNMLSQAVVVDSNMYYAILQIGWAYYYQGMYDEAKRWCLKAYAKRDMMPIQQKIYTSFVHARFFETPYEAIKYLNQLQEADEQWPQLHYDLGTTYSILLQYDRAIPEFEKALEMYRKIDSKPWWVSNYTSLGRAYHETSQYTKEKKLYRKAEQDFPDNPDIIRRQSIMSLKEGDLTLANKYIGKYRSLRTDNTLSEADVNTSLASIYFEADMPDKAEEYYRQALSHQPDNPEGLNNLARFLIDKGRNVEEGLNLNGKALALKPDSYSYLDCKGWGLYKQGKYTEALEILNKSDSLKPVYDHELYLHIQEVKKAIAGRK